MPDLIPMFDDHSHLQINRLIHENALRCVECGAHQRSLVLMIESRAIRPRYVLACGECRYQGPLGKNPDDAVRQWNEPLGFFASFLKKRRQS